MTVSQTTPTNQLTSSHRDAAVFRSFVALHPTTETGVVISRIAALVPQACNIVLMHWLHIGRSNGRHK